MNRSAAPTFRLEGIVLGRWVVLSRRWSWVERDSYLAKNQGRDDLRFVREG